jgi:hypothetical protein
MTLETLQETFLEALDMTEYDSINDIEDDVTLFHYTL